MAHNSRGDYPGPWYIKEKDLIRGMTRVAICNRIEWLQEKLADYQGELIKLDRQTETRAGRNTGITPEPSGAP